MTHGASSPADQEGTPALDWATIEESVRKTRKLVIVEEDNLTGGWGAEVAARIGESCFGYLDAPIRRLNGLHTPTPYSPPLEAAVVPSVGSIAQAIRDLCDE